MHHYFASFGLGWAVDDTRNGAIEKLIGSFRSDAKRILTDQHKRGEPGIYVWTCKVHEPINKPYSIEWFQPKGVEISNTVEHDVTYVTKAKVAFTNSGYVDE